MPRLKPRVTIKQILAWADDHYKRTDRWPAVQSGPVLVAPEVTWSAIESALQRGIRGLPGDDSLAKVLARYHRVRKGPHLPRLTLKRILAWADAHHHRTGRWPSNKSGAIPSAPSEDWRRVNQSLDRAHRGLPHGWTLSKLLAERRGARQGIRAPRLTITQVLAWADAHHKRTGKWPNKMSGRVVGTRTENWGALHMALQGGLRGLPGGMTLAQLLVKHRHVVLRGHQPRLTIKQILLWADRHKRRTGDWPKSSSGPLRGPRAETWSALDQSLSYGNRGLPGGTTLARLLHSHRGVISQPLQRRLNVRQIRAWAREYYHRIGKWPTVTCGEVHGVPGENWRKIGHALNLGLRGLPGGSSLSKTLPSSRRAPSRLKVQQPLTLKHVLAWADEHHQRTGRWPTVRSAAVHNAPSESWGRINTALQQGFRGFSGGSSLAKVLVKHRGVSAGRGSKLTLKQILSWADDHHERAGRWPILRSGDIPEAADLNWRKVDNALRLGFNGLAKGSSLAKLLDKHRGVRNKRGAPALIMREILSWADAYHKRTGTWPTSQSGAVSEAPGETWSAINGAFIQGTRGLEGGSSLARFLGKRRGIRNRKDLPPLTVKQILRWADRHFQRSRRWPTSKSEAVLGATGETWCGIDKALRRGSRGLGGSSSLSQLLSRQRLNLVS